MVQRSGAGERLELVLTGWGRLGEALASHEGGEVRVFGGIPGEVVVAEVIRRRHDYVSATVVDVLEASPYRVAPPCPHFGACTGCQWEHVEYEHQIDLKRQTVVDALDRAGGFGSPAVSPTLPSPQRYGYRNHARFTVGRRKGELGFVNRDSRRFVLIDHCMLMDPWINSALEGLQGKCRETSQLSIRYGVNTGDFLVQPALKNEGVEMPTGQKHYMESIGGREFRIASPSFFQVNTRQAECMAELVKEELMLSGTETVVDAYAGVGSFAILLAPHAGKVIAIEESTSAVDDATANAEGVSGIEFLRGKTEDVLAQIDERPYAVVLDPPRAGCHPEALEALVRLAPDRVVYVSCEPETLARDLKTLLEGPFRLEKLLPIDMFPQTHHVECLATLSRIGSGAEKGTHRVSQGRTPVAEVVLASTSPRRRELMERSGIRFRVETPNVSEAPTMDETPRETAERLALAKALNVAKGLSERLVVGADSLVVCDGEALGKPADYAEATEMLRRLRGREHQVVTGVAVADAGTGRQRVVSRQSSVTMRAYSDEEIDAYVSSGEPMDKAGAYAVQDVGFHPAERVNGCYNNVVGLPLCSVVDLLKDAGYEDATGDVLRIPPECSACDPTSSS